jgi:hypothetical protein
MRVFVPLLYEKATAWLYSHEPTHPLPDHTTTRLREQAEGAPSDLRRSDVAGRVRTAVDRADDLLAR